MVKMNFYSNVEIFVRYMIGFVINISLSKSPETHFGPWRIQGMFEALQQ